MVKNVVDILFGGFTYWAVGYGLSFGTGEGSNSFCGWGNFFIGGTSNETSWLYPQFFFQASFATTATTIVSGAMAERVKMEAYVIFCLLNTFLFCFPAHWVWAQNGWLANLHVIDIAGAGPVHLVGGTTGLIATLILKPRIGRFDEMDNHPMGSPTNALLGLFMLWWGWLGFNCGSTFGISGNKWRLAARSAVATICSSIGGGMTSFILSYIFKRRQIRIGILINGVLGSLVAITGICALCRPWEGFIIGVIGAIFTTACEELVFKLKIDDPVGVIPVHLVASIWGLLAVGLFANPDEEWDALLLNKDLKGLFWGGGWYLFGIQSLAVVAIIAWTSLLALIFLGSINIVIGMRVSPHHEQMGSDLIEHDIGDLIYDKVSHTIASRYRTTDRESFAEDETMAMEGPCSPVLCKIPSLHSSSVESLKDIPDSSPNAPKGQVTSSLSKINDAPDKRNSMHHSVSFSHLLRHKEPDTLQNHIGRRLVRRLFIKPRHNYCRSRKINKQSLVDSSSIGHKMRESHLATSTESLTLHKAKPEPSKSESLSISRPSMVSIASSSNPFVGSMQLNRGTTMGSSFLGVRHSSLNYRRQQEQYKQYIKLNEKYSLSSMDNKIKREVMFRDRNNSVTSGEESFFLTGEK